MNQKAMVKKILSAMLAGTMAVGLLASCGGDSSSSTSGASTGGDSGNKGGDTTIRVAWWGNQIRNDGTVAALNAYSEENPGVTFQTEFNEWSGYWDKMATQAASNNLPDIIQQDYMYIKNYQSKGQLESLDSYIESGILNLDDVPEAVLEGGKIDGQLYALCAGTNALEFIYDKSIVDEAGVTLPEQMTLSDFCEVAKQIYDKTGMQCDISMDIGMYARSLGKEWYKSDEPGIGLTAEEMATYFEYMARGMDEGWQISPDVLLEQNTALETQALPAGKSWCSTVNSNQFVSIAEASGQDDLEIMLPLTADDPVTQPVYIKPAMFWCVTSTSKVKEESVKVLDYLTNSVEANKTMKAERGVPISSVVAEAVKEDLDPNTQKAFDYVLNVATPVATTIDPPYPEGNNECEKLKDDLIEAVRYGEITPEEAGERYVTEGTKILQDKAAAAE